MICANISLMKIKIFIRVDSMQKQIQDFLKERGLACCGYDAGRQNAGENCKGGQNAGQFFGPKIYRTDG